MSLASLSIGAQAASASTRSQSTPKAAAATTAGTTKAATHTKVAKTPYPATGYFSVAQTKKGWTLVTPQGQPFHATAIDTVSPAGSGTDQDTGQCPYCETVANDFPNLAAWGTATIAQIRSWGFNTLGDFSDNALLGSQMPYEIQLSMASGDDWFAPSFVTNADAVAAADVAPLANDPNLIGYFTDSELDWGPLLGSGANTYNTVLAQYLALPSGSPGLAVAQQYQNDPSGFLYALATRYFSVTTAAVHMYDSNHLILGVKAEGQEIEPSLLEAATPYVDVFSIEDYQLMPGFAQGAQDFWHPYLSVQQNLADFEQYVKRPLMIGEYTSIAYGPETPDFLPGIYLVEPNQSERALTYENFVAPLYEDAPWLVGEDWFQYVDDPVHGRTGDGEDDNFGMVDVNGNPYTDMVSAMQLMHGVVNDESDDSGNICDSWATSGSTVTCGANMPTLPTFPLTIVTNTMPVGDVGSSYYFGGVYAAGGTPGYHYSVIQGKLPKGLTFSHSSGMVTGTPTVAGTSSFTVEATDSAHSTPVTQALSITVNPDVDVSVTTTTLKTAKENKNYSAKLAATGGTAPYSWSITSGTLPMGLTLSTAGVITGASSESGTFPITVQVTDSSTTTQAASANLTLTVDPSR